MERSNFHLNKWYLDFVGTSGEAMIFYAAELSWYGMAVHYTSWIQFDPEKDVRECSRFRNVQLPKKQENIITWHDDKFEVHGSWESIAQPVQCRVFDSDAGYLDWHCFQPASKVQLKIKDKIIEGNGYAEQLILTAPPWHIPMNDLRWGRFHSSDNTMVWIELRKEDKQQWLWLNGDKIVNCTIEDDHISSLDKDFLLKLDCRAVLESEKKIYQVVHNLIHYLPGFNKLMPTKFLMADNHKWLSNGVFQKKGSPVTQGIAIHEWVNFNP